MPYLLFTSYHIMKPLISPPPMTSTSSGLYLATIYNQSQLAERKHVALYWSIDTVATAVPLSPHSSAVTKLAAAILGGRLFGGSVLPAQYCPCGLNSPRLSHCCSLPLPLEHSHICTHTTLTFDH